MPKRSESAAQRARAPSPPTAADVVPKTSKLGSSSADQPEDTFDDLSDDELVELDRRLADAKAGHSVDAFAFLDRLAKKK